MTTLFDDESAEPNWVARTDGDLRKSLEDELRLFVRGEEESGGATD